MGVLNFNSTFRQISHQSRIDIDALSLGGSFIHDDPIIEDVPSTPNVEANSPRVRRKRTKSGSKAQYNFQDYGIDERRRGSKHQRRKQNFHELQQLAGDELDDEISFLETQMTVFAELLLDESKMKAWERFIGLPEDKQGQYMEEFHATKTSCKHSSGSCDVADKEDVEEEKNCNFMMIDEKIRDVLRSKQLAHDVNGLLQYYEDDVTSCMSDISAPSIIILDLDSAYDRMLVYAVCQFNQLQATTMKLETKTLVEVEFDEHSQQRCGGPTLTQYLLNHPS